jgi:hypothetical protein
VAGGPPATTVLSISRSIADTITVTLEGKLPGFIVPTELIFERHLGWRPGTVVPETSTWAVLALAFGVFGSAAFRQRKMNIAMLPRRPPSFHRADHERQPVERSFPLLASVDTLGSLAFRPTALSPFSTSFRVRSSTRRQRMV